MENDTIGLDLKEYPLNFEYVVISLINYFEHHTTYAYLLQSVLIFYCYVRGVGRNGKFWKVIYIGTLASFLGVMISNTCKIILDKQEKDHQSIILYYILIANETLYAIRNLVLPYINMIKVIPLLEPKEKKKLKVFIAIMTIVHFAFRYNIALWRLWHKDTSMKGNVIRAYGLAYISVALTDIVCSMIIIKKLIENYHIAARKNLKISVYKYFFQSALFILIFVDFFSLIMGILAVIDSSILKVAYVPLTGLNSNIILLLAFDALIFKNDVMEDMNSEYNYTNYGEGSESRTNEMLQYTSEQNHCRCRYCLENNCNSQSYYQSYYTSDYQSQYDNNESRSRAITVSDQLDHTYDYSSEKG